MSPDASVLSRVLLIEPDAVQAESLRGALDAARFETVWARCGFEGLTAIRDALFDLLLVDLDLPDISGVDLVRTMQAHQDQARVMVISRGVTVAIVAEAIKLGLDCVVESPVDVEQLLTVIEAALQPARTAPRALRVVGRAAAATNGASAGVDPRQSDVPGSVAERWAALVWNTVNADHDPKTMHTWAKSVGVSRSALCEYCRLVHVSPRDARDFARVMRAVHLSRERWRPEMVLDLADARTLKKLLSRAGLAPPIVRTPTLREFVERQRWIPKDNSGRRALECLLHRRGV